MTKLETQELVRAAEEIYYARLQAILEPEHLHAFVAIEPQSGDYFLGNKLSEASQAARQVYPDRLTHIMRVGHRAAVHLGMYELPLSPIVHNC